MVNSLRKVDFSHPTGHYTWKKLPPLEKILGTPLSPHDTTIITPELRHLFCLFIGVLGCEDCNLHFAPMLTDIQ